MPSVQRIFVKILDVDFPQGQVSWSGVHSISPCNVADVGAMCISESPRKIDQEIVISRSTRTLSSLLEQRESFHNMGAPRDMADIGGPSLLRIKVLRHVFSPSTLVSCSQYFAPGNPPCFRNFSRLQHEEVKLNRLPFRS